MLSLTDFGQPVDFYACFGKLAGSARAGLFLSQAYHWSNRTEDPEGWFCKTQDEWYKEIYLSRWEQETARRKLVSLGVLEEKKVGIPPKLHFRVNLERLVELLENQSES